MPGHRNWLTREACASVQIAAGQYAIIAAIAATEWRQGNGGIRKDRVKGLATGTAITCAVLAYRGLTSGGSEGQLSRYPAA
jgi:hypothetical protein